MSGSGCPSVLIWSHDESLGKPLGGVQLLGGPFKPGPVEDTWSLILATGPVGLGPVLIASNEAGLRFNGLRSLKDSGWAKAKESNEESGLEECRGPS